MFISLEKNMFDTHSLNHNQIEMHLFCIFTLQKPYKMLHNDFQSPLLKSYNSKTNCFIGIVRDRGRKSLTSISHRNKHA